jgi:poly(A) polymerase
MCKISRQKETALKVVRILQAKGYQAYFAGGSVRDDLLGRIPKDYDVATNAIPDEVESLFPKTIPIGKAFGVIAVIDGKATVEVATFRKDIGIFDGRHPESITFSEAKEDALRRDFSINGMFYDPIAHEYHDYVHGRRDLANRKIMAIGDPAERFMEDHLRMLRAVRFTHTLGFELDPDTADAIRKNAPLITKVSAERIERELTCILTESAKPGAALQHLYELKLLPYILPEIMPMIGQEQPLQFHPEGDVFEHTILMLNLMEFNEQKSAYTARELAYSILLHDVGKPATASIGPGTDGKPRIRFDGHAAVSAAMAEEILIRLKFPNKEKKHIIEAIRGHMRFMDVQKMRTAKLRKMIGAERFDLEMELHRIDCLGSHAMLDNYEFLQTYMQEMANEPILPEPWLCGHDLINMGIKEGQLIGRILKEAYEAQMEDRFINRAELLEWIRATYPPADQR